jgi:ATPase subunit of ABC transporter with duplicated ATPase domains
MTKGVAAAKRKQPDNDKAARKAKQETTEQLAARASRSERAIERLEVVDKPWEGWQLRFTIAAAPRSGSRVASLADAVVERGDFRLGPVTLEVGWAERVAIVGPNGSGKTTLLGALLGRIPLTSGTSWRGPGVVVGEIDQARATFEGEATLLEAFMAATGFTIAEARTLLAKFSLNAAHVGRPARRVSPGERTRAALALLQARGVNCLVLDEPTNHLDLAAIEQLEAGLDGFGGTVLLVSHDRRLLETVRLTRRIAVADGVVAADDTV